MKKKKKIQDRLAKYGLLAAGILGTDQALAAVVYTDENPDFAGGIGSQYFLDLNNDGTDDFRIWHNGSSNLYISPLAATNDVLGSGGATYAYPFALTAGATISAGQSSWFNNGFSSGYQSLNYGSCSFGNWCSVTDRYIGLRFDIGGNIHYGWVRLDVNAAGSSWTVKDYAYEGVAGLDIDAGEMAAPGAAVGPTGIIGTDIADNNNGTDLSVDFTASIDETTLSEYRIIAVKSSAAALFDLATAQGVAATSYTSITPNGASSYTQVLSSTMTDSDGDPIVIAEPYIIFILGVADGVNATVDVLAQSASPVTLNITADVAVSITGTDVGSNANGTDLQVDFTAAATETGIAEYRAIAVKTSAAGSFTLSNAISMPMGQYASQVPNGGPYSFTFGATDADADGDAITLGVDYTIFVLSVPDTIDANIANIASAAAGVTLNVTADLAQNIVGSDIGDDAVTANDLQVDFDAATNESSVFAYRVFAVKASAAPTFDILTAESLPVTTFIPVVASGGPYSVVFDPTKTDSDGDAIVNWEPYSIFILSYADGITANANDMVQSAATITLDTTSTIGISENLLNDLQVFSSNGVLTINGTDQHVQNETAIELLSSGGQLISSIRLEKNSESINIGHLSSGVYFVRMSDKTGIRRTIKLMF